MAVDSCCFAFTFCISRPTWRGCHITQSQGDNAVLFRNVVFKDTLWLVDMREENGRLQYCLHEPKIEGDYHVFLHHRYSLCSRQRRKWTAENTKYLTRITCFTHIADVHLDQNKGSKMDTGLREREHLLNLKGRYLWLFVLSLLDAFPCCL